jgi:hypothetical protein
MFRGEQQNAEPEEVDRATWFMPRDETEEVFESTLAIPNLGHVLSLIWVIERE